MNPENRGEHIALRHSYLWRNSMFMGKQPAAPEYCHAQLN